MQNFEVFLLAWQAEAHKTNMPVISDTSTLMWRHSNANSLLFTEKNMDNLHRFNEE